MHSTSWLTLIPTAAGLVISPTINRAEQPQTPKFGQAFDVFSARNPSPTSFLTPPRALVTATPALSADTRIVLPQWKFPAGPLNAITDVSGVRVGHKTITADAPYKLRTGVTAIMPHSEDMAATGLWASTAMLNGNGEMTGRGLIDDDGVLNSPIVLTNTYSVGNAQRGVFEFYEKYYPDQWRGQLPVVAECYDGTFNTVEDLNAVQPKDVIHALETSQPGSFAQGRVGAGTGMRSFEMHAGIGSASRRIMLAGKLYTIGVLVNANHSRLTNMNPQIRQALESRLGSLDGVSQQDNLDSRWADTPKPQQTKPSASPRQGSIIVIIATDLPMLPHQLNELAKRAALGIGAMGSTMDTTSGDFALAFSTANRLPLNDQNSSILNQQALHPDVLSAAQRATVEAVTEAQMQALLAAHQ